MQESKDSETGLLLINPPISSASAKSAWRDLLVLQRHKRTDYYLRMDFSLYKTHRRMMQMMSIMEYIE